ncbi:ribonuclease R [Longimonas halophila]|uniref:Ribonuclease R n=1 Tax=Longimonas halophila TaxID=1469170 RepID=A0A2H3NJ52_9BACT|nr:ribonuclease R [Longimonas halophila]PEN05649.1 ribonuclease R [Longimonas halophila]
MRQAILSFLKDHPDRSFRDHEIAQELELDDNQRFLQFGRTLERLVEAELIERDGEKFAHKAIERGTIGVLSAHPRGFGFVTDVETDEEYFIREPHMGTALHGDLVRVAVGAQKSPDKKRECEVLEVEERRRTRVVGTFRPQGSHAIVQPDDNRILQDVIVAKDAYNGAKSGNKVVVSIDRFTDRRASPEGRILNVLGDADDPNVQVLSLAMSMDVRTDFPEPVQREADAIRASIPQSEIERRHDLRDAFIFTIDPDDAKDFDDALHIRKTGNGTWEVGVHIADVSHYVKPDTAIEEEAMERATSVYLVDRTVPMLPEKLSNELCSLRPHEDTLAFSCIMEIDKQGELVDYSFEETVIHSKRRLTYDEAQAFINGDNPDDEAALPVKRAHSISSMLTKNRMDGGGIDFGTDEVKVVLDDDGHPVDIVVKERMPANRLVEEFMLLANRTAARHVADSDDPKPFIYRVHDSPDAERIQKLSNYVEVFGHELPLTDGNATPADLGALIDAIKDQPEEIVITRAALRAMSKAVYTTKNIGHYGLNFPYYTHFTSPIRRYPDLMVHRLLKRYLSGGDAADQEFLEERCEYCSEKERDAESAERESVKLKQVEYAQAHIGDEFKGVVSGVTKFGVFVELNDLLVEGLAHVRDMDDDYYVYDEETYTMRGKNKGTTYRPGDTVNVRIVSANIDKREIDLWLLNDN